MTVADLIERLKAFPQNMKVVQFDGDGYQYGDPSPETIDHDGQTIVAL